MERRLLPPCVLFAATILCAQAGAFSAAAQTQQTREGIITTFAPVVEKVAPSVVTSIYYSNSVATGDGISVSRRNATPVFWWPTS